jgi:hypothetical protein
MSITLRTDAGFPNNAISPYLGVTKKFKSCDHIKKCKGAFNLRREYNSVSAQALDNININKGKTSRYVLKSNLLIPLEFFRWMNC